MLGCKSLISICVLYTSCQSLWFRNRYFYMSILQRSHSPCGQWTQVRYSNPVMDNLANKHEYLSRWSYYGPGALHALLHKCRQIL